MVPHTWCGAGVFELAWAPVTMSVAEIKALPMGVKYLKVIVISTSDVAYIVNMTIFDYFKRVIV